MNMKMCPVCCQKKPIEFFSKNSRRADGHSNECKQCHNEYMKVYSKRNSAAIVAKVAAWRAANPDKAAASYRAHQARRRKAHAGRVNADTAARKAHIKRATPPWANEFFIAEAYELAKLREKVCGGKWHVDHNIPLRGKRVCGLHVETNLRVIPAQENVKKHATFAQLEHH